MEGRPLRNYDESPTLRSTINAMSDSSDVRFPQFFRVRQGFPRPRVTDLHAAVQAELERVGVREELRPGETVAITAGSRGIAGIPAILRAAVECLHNLGAKPFIVPAMGSHGGATAEGQRDLLARYGITEQACGCPIRSSMHTVVLGNAPQRFPVHFDRHAFEADHVIVCGRIKLHTDFRGELQSGLAKMLLVGLGKHAGAQVYHRAFQDHSFDEIAESVAPMILATGKIAAGLAIIENAYEEVAQVEAVPIGQLLEREKELLVVAQALMPRLPFEEADLLIVDEIGKNISGTGMDTNIIGRKTSDHAGKSQEKPWIKRIFVRRLSSSTAGNATGIGLAEFTTESLVDEINFEATRLNCVASGHVTAGMLPLRYKSDADAIEAALATIGLVEPKHAKVLWIRNTLRLVEVECSAAYRERAQRDKTLTVISDLRPLPFDSAGNLPEEGSERMRSSAFPPAGQHGLELEVEGP